MSEPEADPASVFTPEAWPPSVAVVVAVSGGSDSVAALRLAAAAAARLGRRVVAVHVDHRLRPDSGRDADAARDVARLLGVPFDLRIADLAPGAGSFEGRARDARYAALAAAARDHGAERILVAHSREDHWETVLLALRRGGGLGALGGLRPFRPCAPGILLWRPFLAVSRASLRAAGAGLPSVEDPTNADVGLRRNAARLRLLPRLTALEPGFRDVLTRLAAAARAIDERAGARADALRADAYMEPGLVRFSRRAALAAARAARLRFWLDLFRDDPAFGGPPSTGQLRELEDALARPSARAEPRREIVFSVEDDAAILFAPATFAATSANAPAVGDEVLLPAGGPRRLVVRRYPALDDPASAPAILPDPRAMLLFAPPAAEFAVRPPSPGAPFRLETGAGRGRVRDVFRERALASEWRTRAPLVYVADALRWIPGLRRVGAPRAPGEVAFALRLAGPAPWIDASSE